MGEALTISVLAIGIVAATNIDNALLVAALAASGGLAPGRLAASAALAGGAMIACLAAAIQLAPILPEGMLRWLGLVPLGLGLAALFRRVPADGAAAPMAIGPPAIVALLLSNSADTLAALLPLAVETDPVLRPAVLTGPVAGAAALAGIAASAGRLAKGAALRRHGGRVAGLVMVAAGLYVLADTATDRV